MAIRTLVDDKKSEMSNFLGQYILIFWGRWMHKLMLRAARTVPKANVEGRSYGS